MNCRYCFKDANKIKKNNKVIEREVCRLCFRALMNELFQIMRETRMYHYGTPYPELLDVEKAKDGRPRNIIIPMI